MSDRRADRPADGGAARAALARVDFAAPTIRVAASYTAGTLGTPKSGLGRAVPFVDEVAQALARLALRERFTGPDELVFAGVTGGHLDGSALRRRYKVARDAARLRPLRFHDYADLRVMPTRHRKACSAAATPVLLSA